MKKRYLLLAMLASALALSPIFAVKDAGPPGSIQTILQGSAMVDYGLVVIQDNEMPTIATSTPIKESTAYIGQAFYGATLSKPNGLITSIGNDNLYTVPSMIAPHRGNNIIYFDPRGRLQSLARDQTAAGDRGLL